MGRENNEKQERSERVPNLKKYGLKVLQRVKKVIARNNYHWLNNASSFYVNESTR